MRNKTPHARVVKLAIGNPVLTPILQRPFNRRLTASQVRHRNNDALGVLLQLQIAVPLKHTLVRITRGLCKSNIVPIFKNRSQVCIVVLKNNTIRPLGRIERHLLRLVLNLEITTLQQKQLPRSFNTENIRDIPIVGKLTINQPKHVIILVSSHPITDVVDITLVTITAHNKTYNRRATVQILVVVNKLKSRLHHHATRVFLVVHNFNVYASPVNHPQPRRINVAR